MDGIVSKFITTILTVLALFYFILSMYVISTCMNSQVAILNDTVNFIDKVTDTGLCGDDTLEDFYIGCNSHNTPVDVKVERYEPIINPTSDDGSTGTNVTYMLNSDIANLSQGDVVKVKVHYLHNTGMQLIVQKVLSIYNMQTDFTMSGVVRH